MKKIENTYKISVSVSAIMLIKISATAKNLLMHP